MDGKIIYQGMFKDDEYHGRGQEFWPNGHVKYDGMYINSRRNGFGQSYWENGNRCVSGNVEEVKIRTNMERVITNIRISRFSGDSVLNIIGDVYNRNGQLISEGEFRVDNYIWADFP